MENKEIKFTTSIQISQDGAVILSIPAGSSMDFNSLLTALRAYTGVRKSRYETKPLEAKRGRSRNAG